MSTVGNGTTGASGTGPASRYNLVLWQRVVPMLRCWRILVPLALEPGYEDATTHLKKMLAMPERIKAGT
jgi:hypothetical protein